MFPDEFHLITLDQLLGAIAQLNPHVNIKAIVIGLMDRLSAYAARESDAEAAEDREKLEQDATAKLLEDLKISKEKDSAAKVNGPQDEQPNGEPVDGSKAPEPSEGQHEQSERESEVPNGIEANDSNTSRKRGIPENVRLYEIFYDQVLHLVNAQRLHIHDTIALLVSLTNLAL